MIMRKRILSTISAFFIAFASVCVTALAEVTDSGYMDSGAAWSLDDSGTMTISGDGPMVPYNGSIPNEPYPGEALRSDIKTVIISHGITNISANAFADCENLTSVYIADTVESIDTGAFKNCTGLYYFDLPDSIIDIGENAFFNTAYYNDSQNWDNLALCVDGRLLDAMPGVKNYTVPENVYAICENAFSDCQSLTGITIPDGVRHIGDRAFEDCSELASISLPDSLESVGRCVLDKTAYFNDASNWDGGVLYADNVIFAADENTTDADYTVKDGTRIISDYALNMCDLNSVTLPSSLKYMGVGLYADEIHIADIESWLNLGFGKDYYCDTLSLFLDGSPVTSITIPEGVTRIRDYAFVGCDTLTDVTLHDGITEIGDFAFSNCGNLADISLPEGLKKIGYNAFYRCYALPDVTIPSSVTSVGCGAFYDTPIYDNDSNWENGILYKDNILLYALTYEIPDTGELKIREGTRVIADETFLSFWKACVIILPDSLQYIGDNVFEYAFDFSFTKLPSELISVGDGAFMACNFIDYYSPYATIITFPDSVRHIGDRAFAGCGFDSIIMSDGLTEIGDYAFADIYCPVTLPDTLEKIGSFAFSGAYLDNIAIPQNVKEIGVGAFKDCEQLTTISLPGGIETIAAAAFSGCPLTGIYYNGTEEQWNLINIEGENTSINNAHIYFLPETQLAENGDGTITLTVTPPSGIALDNASVYAVIANTDGVPVSLDTAAASDSTQLTISPENAESVKIFIWDENMCPLTTAA